MPRRKEGERGLALVIVLWVIAAAALMVLSFNASVRSGATVSAVEQRYSKVETLLDAGLEIAATRLIDEDKDRRWPADGAYHYVDFGGARLEIAINDPNGLIDLNKAKAEVLFTFFLQFTASRVKAAQLRDLIVTFRGEAKPKNATSEAEEPKDNNPNPSGNSGSTEPGNTQAATFADITQFRRIETVDPELFRQAQPFLTLYSRDGRINPNSAPRQVLMSIPKLTVGEIEKLLILAGRDGIDDSNVLSSPVTKAKEYFNLETGPAFIVSVRVQMPGLKTTVGKEFVISTGLDGKAPYRLLSWKLVMPPA